MGFVYGWIIKTWIPDLWTACKNALNFLKFGLNPRVLFKLCFLQLLVFCCVLMQCLIAKHKSPDIEAQYGVFLEQICSWFFFPHLPRYFYGPPCLPYNPTDIAINWIWLVWLWFRNLELPALLPPDSAFPCELCRFSCVMIHNGLYLCILRCVFGENR